ncbi:related to Avl9 protein [Ramularia collo-cygni]|uniref:Related to Avl9 protein n=1 Tax=Ramularia collo-cygni TaxID=112498 RepID=A0A2D3VB07_9PEZI|nr:related to Avl9 protein [Ramularia collo-cygni]CZT19854.1 related to Avl9 protein [Ramularia collo-cygni]
MTFQPLLCIVDFHHHKGPEIQEWIGAEDGIDPAAQNDWGLIPYMALPDGAHQSEEEFSYFSLVHKATGQGETVATSVFGISCMHQIDSSELLFRPPEVTRSAVQKAVVAITDRPQSFSALRERLSVVTRAWFAQKDFRDIEILQRFQESLAKEGTSHDVDDRDQFFGLSLRELLHTFKWTTLVLLKCLLLQKKILFFGSHCERLCQVQFSLISLIPGLVRNLGDCADPQMDHYAQTRTIPNSVRTSDRTSLLAYVGLPLQLFGKGAMFGPYTPLQQLDLITDQETKSYVVGSTNSLLLSQKERYCDLLLNLDENAMTILTPSLKSALSLTTADRRWIDFLTQAVNDTWDENDPSRPSTHGYAGSEEFIRLQFEEYIIALLSSTKYHQYLADQKSGDTKTLLSDVEGDPSSDFSNTFIEAWQHSENYGLWNRTTDSHLFDIVEPRHPCAGGLTIEDVQRRLATQVSELHLDERFNQTRDVVGKRLADGRTQVTSAFNKVWADIEVMREAQRQKSEEARIAAAANPPVDKAAQGSRFAKPDMQQAQASVAAAGQRAGAYFSSWGSWAAEKRKTAWAGRAATSPAAGDGSSEVAAGSVSEVKSEVKSEGKEEIVPTSTREA